MFQRIAFLSTLSLRRATVNTFSAIFEKAYFYPRPPCGERQNCCPYLSSFTRNFYPRSPCGERPDSLPALMLTVRHFYPRSPCGERLIIMLYNTSSIMISIHALLAESDLISMFHRPHSQEFLSTLSLRRATVPETLVPRRYQNFYPRSPCGERLVGVAQGADTGDISIHALLAESDALRQL